MNKDEYKEKLKNLSEIFKTIGHPTRLCIVCKLMSKNLNVTEMQDCLEMPQSTVSQHLAILKSKGIVEGNRNGVEVIYSLVDEDIKKIVNSIFSSSELKKFNE
ncbi:ArsR/SmtB family transcription factor [Clostridium sp. ZS2-4]|uniref:ArsR/SmtB family transcription factor n=1 Tax=Clostridium sp. ZS2-4 TaxID=2987703 RepID=UPI00227B56F3|nr:metalloregulator ArsR/SmtB family transcription factor [Clostridium sp. ZS2-4]MCY6354927.1 metalloregulator ArsR/SmtB family transcription factor [Clostridium sp. ZS2-4]